MNKKIIFAIVGTTVAVVGTYGVIQYLKKKSEKVINQLDNNDLEKKDKTTSNEDFKEVEVNDFDREDIDASDEEVSGVEMPCDSSDVIDVAEEIAMTETTVQIDDDMSVNYNEYVNKFVENLDKE